MARKPTLTQAIQDELHKYIKEGLTYRAATAAAGIAERTFFDWLSRGEKDKAAENDTMYSQFLQSIRKAEATHQTGRLNVIRKAANEGSWQAAAWELERRYREDYGRNSVDAKVELTGKDGGPVKTKSTVQIYIPDNGRDKKPGGKGKK